LALDLCVETVCSWGVQWVSKAIQFEGLADGRESILDCSGFDLESLAKSTLPCPFSESLKDVNPFFWSKAMEVGIKTGPKECTPVTPIMLLFASTMPLVTCQSAAQRRLSQWWVC